MLRPRIDIFTDRDGDTLSVIPRDRSEGGNPVPDPVLSITRTTGTREQTFSVVMTDKDALRVVAMLIEHLLGDYEPYNDEETPQPARTIRART